MTIAKRKMKLQIANDNSKAKMTIAKRKLQYEIAYDNSNVLIRERNR